MFTLSNALKNQRRHPIKALLYLLICLIATLTVTIYMAGIDRTAAQLAATPAAMPVTARVANLDGSRYSGLQIKEITVNGLQNSELVRDLELAVILNGGVGYFDPIDYKGNLHIGVIGVNSFDVLHGISPDAITWHSGYDADFLLGTESACIVDELFMRMHNWKVGDIVPLNIYYFKYEGTGAIVYEPLALADILIVGTADMSMALTNGASINNVVLPLEYVRELFHDDGLEMLSSSAAFGVSDPSRLNEFKTEMKKLLLFEMVTDGSAAFSVMANIGTALLVNDAAFISAATRLQESLTLLRAFLPLLVIVLAAIGYFVAYLMIQNRREEYAVLRLLGLGAGKSVLLFFTEAAILTIAGGLIGGVVSVAFKLCELQTGAIVFAISSLCFFLGSLLSLWRLSRTNVMLALAQSE